MVKFLNIFFLKKRNKSTKKAQKLKKQKKETTGYDENGSIDKQK